MAQIFKKLFFVLGSTENNWLGRGFEGRAFCGCQAGVLSSLLRCRPLLGVMWWCLAPAVGAEKP